MRMYMSVHMYIFYEYNVCMHVFTYINVAQTKLKGRFRHCSNNFQWKGSALSILRK